jgi:hypothetical protein
MAFLALLVDYPKNTIKTGPMHGPTSLTTRESKPPERLYQIAAAIG